MDAWFARAIVTVIGGVPNHRGARNRLESGYAGLLCGCCGRIPLSSMSV
jgi:hypothetical protein